MRWRLSEDDDGQAALFDEEVERHIGRGEFRGMEFLHVNARTIINEIPKASMLPFRWTINAYRGCSHACSYCTCGDTAVLLANGRTKPIAELVVGDDVFGTRQTGDSRILVPTHVLDQWSTTKPSYRVRAADGTEVVASRDHRLLTTEGWKPLRTLGPGHRLVGSGRLLEISPPQAHENVHKAGVDVVAIDRPTDELTLYDITTGTGDFIANGVVSHNCFARPTHEYLDMNAGDDFERKIVVKVNAIERLKAELNPARWAGDHIAMGTNTDPYQRCEGKYRLTRGIVEVLAERANPFSILTKSTLILRDLDVLTEAAQRADVRANLSIGTLDEEVWKASEPGTPHPKKRVEAVAKLNEAGIPTGVLVAPVLPGLSDGPDQLREVVKACADAGAVTISPILLHLRPGVREQYMPWIEKERPDLLPLYEALYPRSYAPKSTQQRVTKLVYRYVREFGGVAVQPGTTRDTGHEKAKAQTTKKRRAAPPAQLDLNL
jgi:DNA repair photolyase